MTWPGKAFFCVICHKDKKELIVTTEYKTTRYEVYYNINLHCLEE